MRGIRQQTKDGRMMLVCPACGNRLAEHADGGYVWGRGWHEGERPGLLVFRRMKYQPLRNQASIRQGDPTTKIGYRHPTAVAVICPGRSGEGCGEEVDIV